MKMLSAAIAAAALAIIPGGAPAASDPPPGAAACSGCHATNPAAETPVPKIHGRKASDIMASMAQFRWGVPSTVMGRIAKGFTDEELEPIATWLEQQR
jgi:cytochrome c553